MAVTQKNLEKVSYLVVVKILEARDLKGENSGGVNPYVQIECGPLEPQKTKTIYNTSTAIWNQQFTFPDLKLNKFELETLELNISVYDQQHWFTNQLIGSYSIGLSTMYRQPNSDIYKKWLRLTKSDAPTTVLGYLQVSCFIVGPGMKQPVHNDSAGNDEGDPLQEQMIKDGATPDMILEAQKAKQGLSIVEAPNLNWQPYQLQIKIYRAENLQPLNDDPKNLEFPWAFISVRSQGITLNSIAKCGQGNPTWNYRINIPVYSPTFNEKIKVTLYHKDQSFLDGSEYIIANIPEFPNGGDVMNIQTLHSKEGQMDPIWFNLYGIRPQDQKKGSASLLNASAYMGRVLMSFHLIPDDRPRLATQQIPPAQKNLQTTYMLWIELYELVNCEDLYNSQDGENTFVTVQAFLNGHVSEKKKAEANLNRSFSFKEEKLEKLEVNLPQDGAQIPDLFINVNVTTYASADEKDKKKSKKDEDLIVSNERAGFIRLNSKHFVNKTQNLLPTPYEITSIESRNKKIGRLLLNARLVKFPYGKRQTTKPGREVQYHFFTQIFSGYELAPNVPENDLRTRVEIKIGSMPKVKRGGQDRDNAQKIKTRVLQGRFPQWNFSKKPQLVSLNQSAQFAQDMRVLLYQIEEHPLSGKNQKIIGQFLVPISSLEKNLYKRPQYYNLIDGEGQLQGKILARFFLKRREQAQNDEELIQNYYRYMKQMIQNRPYVVDLKISVLGIRALAEATDNAHMEISLTKFENIHGVTVQEAFKKNVKNKKGGNGDDMDDLDQRNDDEENNIYTFNGLKKQDGVHYKSDGTVQIIQRKINENSDEHKLTKNPNFGKVIVFKQIKLQEDMLLWPHLIIKFFANGIKQNIPMAQQQETSRVVLPIFIFADNSLYDSFMNHHDVKMTLGMLMDNQTNEIQSNQNPLITYAKQLQIQMQSVKSDIPRYLQLEIDDKEEVQDGQLQQIIDDENLESMLKIFDFTDKMIVDEDKITENQLDQKEQSGVKLQNTNKSEKLQDADGDGHPKNQHDKEKAAKAGVGQDDDGSSEEIDLEDFKDLKEVWAEFLDGKTRPGAAGGANNVANQKKKKAKQADDDEFSEDEESKAPNANTLGLNISPWEEDPVQEQFMMETECKSIDKINEKQAKEDRRKILDQLLMKVQKIQDSLQNKRNTQDNWMQYFRQQMMNCRLRIQETNSKTIDEEDFDSYNKQESENQRYGNREVVNEPLENIISVLTPFITQRLLEQKYKQMWEFYTTDNFSYNQGIFSAGKPNNSTLRFMVRIDQNYDGLPGYKGDGNQEESNEDQDTGVDDSDKNSYDGELSDSSNEALQKARLTVGAPGFGMNNNDEEDLGITKEEIQKLNERDNKFQSTVQTKNAQEVIDALFSDFMNIKVDVFRVSTIEQMVKPSEYSMRVFVRSCQNLSAVDNRVIDFRNQLAGDLALSSADPYLKMQIKRDQDLIVYDGRPDAKEETLDPTFYADYEAYPISLQEDWRFEVEVWDKGTFQYQDTLIGTTMIDLEHRRWSNQYALAKLAIQQEIDIANEKIEEVENINKMKRGRNIKDDTHLEYVRYLRKHRQIFMDVQRNFLKLNLPQSKVEIRPLLNPARQQAQGMVELYVDVLDVDESKLQQHKAPKEQTNDEDYELRLVIWETRDIQASGSTMTAEIRASYAPEGLSVQKVEKVTDQHAGAKEGKATFNWRMIFKIKSTEQYPRLTLSIFDVGLAGNEAIGELTLDLRASIKLLNKLGVLDEKKIWAPFYNPSKNNAQVGYCLIQMKLLHASEAENDPVGEERNEPNKDPFLPMPTEGRGLGDRLAGLGLSVPKIELPDMFGLIKRALIVLAIVMILFFIMFMILAVK